MLFNSILETVLNTLLIIMIATAPLMRLHKLGRLSATSQSYTLMSYWCVKCLPLKPRRHKLRPLRCDVIHRPHASLTGKQPLKLLKLRRNRVRNTTAYDFNKSSNCSSPGGQHFGEHRKARLIFVEGGATRHKAS